MSGEQAAAPSTSTFAARCDAIEEAYEFMLAYAAQGLPNEEGSLSGSQIRDFLRKCDAALTGLGDRGRSGQQSKRQHRGRREHAHTAHHESLLVVIELPPGSP